jgi:AcrR family transcriptional regulator
MKLDRLPLIREPQQKRSIDKKSRIMNAGFKLFCEKGYHNTNTSEIANKAGVSTGTVYSYFKDKKDIYVASFENFLNNYLQPLVDDLANTPKPIDIRQFVDKCIEIFRNLYVNSKQTIKELGTMQETDPEIMQHFANYEDIILSAFVKALDTPNIDQQNLDEKMYLIYTLADVLGQEYAFGYHNSIRLDILREEVTNMLANLLIIDKKND